VVCAALGDLYYSTNGSHWEENWGRIPPSYGLVGWVSAASGIAKDYCSDFARVTCDGNGAIIELKLASRALSGTIPPSLSRLSKLRKLQLNWNEQISGSLPPSLSSLTDLQELQLQNNALSGTIPPWMGSLTSLTYLNLQYNAFSGTIPPELSSLTNLRSLYLSTLALSGTIPPSLSSLSNLQYLFLLRSGLCGTIPMAQFQNWANDGSLPAC